jgi:hypothetical protein
LAFPPHLKSQITSLSLKARTYSHLPPAKRRAASDGRNSDTLACHVVGTCVIKRTCTVSEDQICCVSQIRSREGSSVRAVHVFDRGEYQVTAAHFVCMRVSGLVMCLSSSLSFRLFEARSLVWVPFYRAARFPRDARSWHVGWLAKRQVHIANKNPRVRTWVGV